MTTPLVSSYWRGSDGTQSDLYGSGEPYGKRPDVSSYRHYGNEENYSLSPANGSAGYPYVDEELRLSTGNPSWSSTEVHNFPHEDANLDVSEPNHDPFRMRQLDAALPRHTSHSSAWPNPKHSTASDVVGDDIYSGGNTDRAFADADDDNEISQSILKHSVGSSSNSFTNVVWDCGGKRSSVKPSKANKCLRASERINERIAAAVSSHKSSRTTHSSSKSTSKSHSKGSHSTHHKKKSSRN